MFSPTYATLATKALGNNEIAEAALVRHLVNEARQSGEVQTVTVKARVAPSGTVYLPQYYSELGFEPVPEAMEFSEGPGALRAAKAREAANELPSEKVGWGGMWVEEDSEKALRHVLVL